MIAVLFLAGCGLTAKAEPSAIERAVLDAATSYASWGRLDDVARWTPTPCAAAGRRAEHPAGVSSAREGPHQDKLYFLYARDPGAYAALNWVDPSPVGQTLVKESFAPVELKAEETTESPVAQGSDGKRYRAGQPRELFIMLKMPPDTPNTDHGWVYAIVEPGGQKVQEAGVISSCKSCHHPTKFDHLFGVGSKGD